MLRVWRPSGQELTALSAEDFKDLAVLKKHLSEQYGFPVYLQKLMHGGRLLTDDAELEGAMDLQLVLLTISSLPQGFNFVAASDLASAAATNHIQAVRCLLEAGAEADYGDSVRQDGSNGRIGEWPRGGCALLVLRPISATLPTRQLC